MTHNERIENRLRRIETKLSRLLRYHNLDPATGDPVTPEQPADFYDDTRVTSQRSGEAFVARWVEALMNRKGASS